MKKPIRYTWVTKKFPSQKQINSQLGLWGATGWGREFLAFCCQYKTIFCIDTPNSYPKSGYIAQNKEKEVEAPGIDPGTSRMLSERSTIWATPPTDKQYLDGCINAVPWQNGQLKKFIFMLKPFEFGLRLT